MKIKLRVFSGKDMLYVEDCDREYYIDQRGDVFYDTDETWYPTLSQNECLDPNRTDKYIYKWICADTAMLHVGTVDRNGKEIYDGDILEFDEEEWGGGPVKDRRWVVTWNSDEGAWDTGGGTYSECKEWKTVIGNIHQNPELMEE